MRDARLVAIRAVVVRAERVAVAQVAPRHHHTADGAVDRADRARGELSSLVRRWERQVLWPALQSPVKPCA
ncbi:MAG: hypothetical protein JNJ54_16460 [Myxococcaceae bacterium]|nr:hypothetical protein [Myxococcaceae bacterium]